MDNQYIPSFVKRLASVSPLPLQQLADGEVLQRGNVYICSSLCMLHFKNGMLQSSIRQNGALDYNPNIDKLFFSIAPLCQEVEVLSIILTGIGSDGAAGMQAIAQNGGRALTESCESAIVFGMPCRAKELVPEAKDLHLDGIIDEIQRFV